MRYLRTPIIHLLQKGCQCRVFGLSNILGRFIFRGQRLRLDGIPRVYVGLCLLKLNLRVERTLRFGGGGYLAGGLHSLDALRGTSNCTQRGTSGSLHHSSAAKAPRKLHTLVSGRGASVGR